MGLSDEKLLYVHLSIISWADVLKCLLLLCATIGLLFLIGSTLLRTIGRTAIRSWTNAFFALVTGLVFITSAYAIFATRGTTLLLLCPALALAFVYQLKREASSVERNMRAAQFPGSYVKALLLMAVVATACFLVTFVSADPQKVSFYGDDHTFYATLAAYLNTTGLENTFPDFFKAAHYDKLTPYHYGDVWWLALLARSSGLNTSVLLALVWYPSLAVIAGVGIAATTESVYPSSRLKWWLVALLPFIIVVVSGFAFLYPSFIFNWNRYDRSFYTAPKYLTACFLILWVFICYYRRAYLLFAIAAVIAAQFFLSFAIPVILASSLLVALALIRKAIRTREFLACASILLVGLLYPFLFYKLFSHATGYLIFHPDYRLFSVSDIRQVVFGLAVANVVQLSCYLAQGIFIYLLYRKYRKSNNHHLYQAANARHILFFVWTLLLCGYISMIAAYNRSLDYWQLYTQVLIPMMNAVFAVTLLISFNKESGRLLQIAGCIILLVNFKYSYLDERRDGTHGSYTATKREYEQALKFIKEPQPKFAEITAISSNDSNVYSISTQVLKRLYFLSYKLDPYINVSINTPSIPTGPTPRLRYLGQGALNTAPFSIYYAQHNGTPEKLGEIQLSYLREHGIHYILTQPHEIIPAAIKPYIQDSLLLPEHEASIFYVLFPSDN